MVTKGPFPKGMNNRALDHEIPEGAVRNAVNGDFDQAGKFRTRAGYLKKYSGNFLRNGFSCPAGAFLIEGNTLKKVTVVSGVPTMSTLYKGITGSPCAWLYHESTVYFSDGTTNLKIANGAAKKWGITPPDAPVINSTAVGVFTAGRYMFVATFVDSDGVESGASDISIITTSGTGGFTITLPISDNSDVQSVRIYASTPDGTTMYQVADVAAGTASYSLLTGTIGEGKPIGNLLFASPPPACYMIRYYAGRLYLVTGTEIYTTLEFSYDHVNLDEGNISFLEEVDICEPVGNGIFVSAEQTFFLAGRDPSKFDQQPKSSYKGVRGTGRQVQGTENPVAIWQSEDGATMGFSDGSIKNIQKDMVAPGGGEIGSSIIREHNGIRQFIASIAQPSYSSLAANCWIGAEVIRRGA